jgi:hypothetical protein
MKPPRD